MEIKGFFVDWNGSTRRTENPGPGYTCLVDLERNHVDVVDGGSFVIFECTYFPTLESVVAADIEIKLLDFPDIIRASSEGIIVENCVFEAAPESATAPDAGENHL
ncbi:hypothetical protein [Pseudomonas serbica]|uniref:hypothetical protein n=1 Tax=Pseudomonas serbica TaxID=2965074 RepID=UPI00237B186B|nr:hypothetical protein [Pseudomonas serbica]